MSEMETTTKAERALSVFGDSKIPEKISGTQQFTLAKVQGSGLAPRWWRITINRLTRQDGGSPLGGSAGGTPSDTSLTQQQYPGLNAFPYSAGYMRNTTYSLGTWPQRSHPVGGSFINPIGMQVSIQINWGNGGQQLGRLVADYPWQGASIVVYGSQVEVVGGVTINTTNLNLFDPGGLPVLSAFLSPIDGISTQDSGELSISQTVLLQPWSDVFSQAGGAVYVPDFARRVRVVPVAGEEPAYWLPFPTGGGLIPSGGYLGAVVSFTNEAGITLDQYFMGTNAQGHVPPEWMPVPAQAVMMTIVQTDASAGNGTDTALVHWRVAP